MSEKPPQPLVSVPAQAFIDRVCVVAIGTIDIGYRSAYIHTAKSDALDMRSRAISGRMRHGDLSVLEVEHVLIWLDAMLADTRRKIELALEPLLEPLSGLCAL